MMLSMLYWFFLIFFLVPSVGALNLPRPQVIVSFRWFEEKKVVLSCIRSGGDFCFWTKEDNNGESTTIATSYSYDSSKYDLGDPLRGDCSITIKQVNYRDEGNLTCVIWPSQGFFSAVWELIVGKAPEDILIQHNGHDLFLKEKNEIYPDEEGKAVITCIVREGKPPAKVEWIGDIAPEDEITETVEIENRFTTVHKILTMMINATDMKPERTVTCVAFHDLFMYKQRLKTVTVGVKHATKNVSILDDSRILPGSKVVCQGDGIPEPSIRWQYKKIGSVEWSELTPSRIATLENYGEYRCQARNELNYGQWQTSSIILFRLEGISKVCTSRGIIN